MNRLTRLGLALLLSSFVIDAPALEFSIDWVTGDIADLNWSQSYENCAPQNHDDVAVLNRGPTGFRILASDGSSGTVEAYLRFHATVESVTFYNSPVAASGHGAWTPDFWMSGRFGDDTAGCVLFAWNLCAQAPEASGPDSQYFCVVDDFLFDGVLTLLLGHVYDWDYSGWLSARPAHDLNSDPIPGSGAMVTQSLETSLRLKVPDAGHSTAGLLTISLILLAVLRCFPHLRTHPMDCSQTD